MSLILRVSYNGYLFEDDGFWFTAAEQILRGKALYREVYFDKPPLLPLVYALLFKVFGAHIIVIRLFTVVFAIAVSGFLYLCASSLYDRKTGVLAAALFAFFSTTGVSGHVQGLNTDFLMALPYLVGASLLILSLRSRPESRPSAGRSSLLAIAGGAVTGIAVQTNPKGIFNLVFFAVLLGAQILVSGGHRKSVPDKSLFRPSAAAGLLALSVVGMLGGSLPFLAYVAAVHSIGDYFGYVWGWGFRYAGYFPLSQSFITGMRVVLGYLALNGALTIGLLFFLLRLASRYRRQRDLRKMGARESARGTSGSTPMPASRTLETALSIQGSDAPTAIATGPIADIAQSRRDEPAQTLKAGGNARCLGPDFILFIWLTCSFAAMMIGGRFYTHYIFEILPALCLVSARGLIYFKRWAGSSALRGKRRYAARWIWWVLAASLLVTLVRFHTRTAVLAMDWVRATKSQSTTRWFHEILNREERMAAAIVSELPGGPEQAMMLPPEAIRAVHPAPHGTPARSDYLFVWGYRPEVYYWSGLIPASRFISIQPVTGIPADVQYINGNARSLLPETARQAALDQLLKDLEETKPKYIVDEAGMFNSALAITSYPGIGDLMLEYRQVEATGRLMVYRRRDPSRKKHLTGPQ